MLYIHIMPHHSKVHNYRLIRMIEDNPRLFGNDEHVFVIRDREVFESKMENLRNVILEEDIDKNYKKFCEYVDRSDYVFLHENTIVSLKILCRLKKRRLKKIIWCVWGHDLYTEGSENIGFLRGLKRKISLKIRKRISKKFYAIGIGFKYDAIKIRKEYGEDIKIVYAPYGYIKGSKESIDKIIASNKNVKHNYLKVMIGHSAYEFLNYFNTLDLLKKYKEENIKISMVLVYGDQGYASAVKERAIGIFGQDKVEVISEPMPANKYREYLDSVDVCIFNFSKQAALGNFYDLCYFGKKIFLMKGGILDLAAKGEKMEVFYVSDIEKMAYKDFSSLSFSKENEQKFGEYYVNESNYLKMWKNTLDALRLEKEHEKGL